MLFEFGLDLFKSISIQILKIYRVRRIKARNPGFNEINFCEDHPNDLFFSLAMLNC